MFPLNSNQSYIKDTGERTTLGAVIGSGGGGGTPDFDNNRYIIAEKDDFIYYCPMEKEYSKGIYGYEVKTNAESSQSDAKVDVYKIWYDDKVLYAQFIMTVHHSASYGQTIYADDYITVNYVGSIWSVAFDGSMYGTNGSALTSPITWSYSTTKDQILLTEDPS